MKDKHFNVLLIGDNSKDISVIQKMLKEESLAQIKLIHAPNLQEALKNVQNVILGMPSALGPTESEHPEEMFRE